MAASPRLLPASLRYTAVSAAPFTALPSYPSPSPQCGLFVAGIWGIVLFREVQGARALALYWLSGGVLIAGAALLANAKED